MKTVYSQKTTRLCFWGGLTLVLVAGIAFELFSAKRDSESRVIERVIETANGPVTVYETVETVSDPPAEQSTGVADPMAGGEDMPIVPPPSENDTPTAGVADPFAESLDDSSDNEAVEDPSA